MFFLWIFTLCWLIDCHCEQEGFAPALAIKGNVLNECTVRPLNWWTHPKRYSLFLDTLQEPGSAKCAGRRRMGRNCCTRKLIRSNVDMQSQLEGPEISSNKDCKLAVIWTLLVCLRKIPICVYVQVISSMLHGNYAPKKANEIINTIICVKHHLTGIVWCKYFGTNCSHFQNKKHTFDPM